MGESACLVHSFSYASGIPNDSIQGNSMLALGESVSFGRFMSESLAWEKWSTFSHNRYVEEAERYAQPGSVAQKKAFFEAHYKRIAAKRAAALLEQANAEANTGTTTEAEAESVVTDNSIADSQAITVNSSHVVVNEPPEQPAVVKTDDLKPDFTVLTDNAQSLNVKPFEPAINEVTEREAALEAPVKKDSSKPPDNLDNLETVSAAGLSGSPQMEKPLLKQNFSSDQDASSVKSKKKSAFSSLKSSVNRKSSKVPCTPVKPMTPHIKKESNATTPITKKSTLDFAEKKRSTAKSIRTFIYSTPAREHDKVLTPASRKTDSRIAPDSSKASMDCRTPLSTQNTAASARMSKHPSATTRYSADTRTKTPVDGNKTTGPKWHILSAVCSKSLTACRNKLQSPTLRTEERGARRKQKLEEKFNSKEVQKVQLQTKLKEKAELELRKLRQSFCFKARPLPEFYKERESHNIEMKKNPVTQPQSAKLGRDPSSRMQGTVSLPSSISLTNNGKPRHVSEKNGRTANYSASLPETINHKNASPNIQVLIR